MNPMETARTLKTVMEPLEVRLLLSTVTATVETTPVPHSGDAADDIAIWVHPTDPDQSTIIGTDKDSNGGLAVYDLSGAELGFFPDGKMNNVDIRYGFELDGKRVDLVIASNRSSGGSVAVYKVNPATRLLENVAARTLETEMDGNVYGATLYKSSTSGKFYAFVSSRSGGNIEQWELFDNGTGKVDGEIVRTFHVGSTSEAMAVDDETGDLYVAEENVGIWKYSAEPSAGTARTQIDKTGSGGHLTADVEGLAIYYAADGKGYILCSSQGSDDYTIYTRDGDNDYIGRFDIGSGVVDAVTDSDGIDVQSFGLGAAFPQGVFVTQDGSNSGGQNFKLVPWQNIAAIDPAEIQIDTSQNPRGPVWLDDNGSLHLTGTDDNDEIAIERIEEDDRLVIRMDGRALESFSRRDVRRILVNVLGGDDRVRVKQGELSMRVPLRVNGGRGNDTIVGGNGADWLNGGGGNDKLYGRGGNDSLAGGSGSDRLAGDGGADTLIGGTRADRLFIDDGDEHDEDPDDQLVSL